MRTQIDGVQEFEINGSTIVVPQIIENDHVIVFEVKREDLDDDKLFDSSDHAPEMFPPDLESFVYDGDIRPHSIVNIYRVDLK